MKFKTEMYDYQKNAYEKLRSIKIGALYMEMGTGKTRVALELIKNRLDRGKINNVLWLCPCSVKNGLKMNLADHTDNSSLIQIHGIESLSQSDRLYFKLLTMVDNTKTFLIVDESNLVKNHFAKRTDRIQELAKKCEYRIILNGTPVSRNEADLFAQWYILDWRILGYKSYWSFAANHLEYDKYGKLRRVLNVDYLTEKIAPYSYTIEKKECLTLPDKKYSVAKFEMTEEQYACYLDAFYCLMGNIDEFDSTTIYKLFTGLQQVASGNKIINTNPLISEPIFKDPLENPRIKALLKEVDGIDEKIIIWCKFKKEIEDIEKVLSNKYGKDKVALFYGGTSLKKRVEELERFKNGARYLIANKVCGGYGLNLQFCSNMIYYSNDFNWATRAQSEDRVHRIGQENEVYIVDICSDGKIDYQILENLNNKENLSDWFMRELAESRDKLIEWMVS